MENITPNKKSTQAKLSIIIVAKNEALNIIECIHSASFADEVLVLDSGSTDLTVELAKSVGAKVIETDWQGYGLQQNKGIEASSGDWIYSLDADERITPALAYEIRAVIDAENKFVFDVPRKSLFVSKFMCHSGWWPDRTRRLFKRGCAKFTLDEIHANLKTTYPIGHLREHMVHYSYRNLHEVIEKMNRYSSGSARDLSSKGKRSSLKKAVAHGIWAFIRTYFIKLGFLDGSEGFILAILNAENSYYKHLKLFYLFK